MLLTQYSIIKSIPPLKEILVWCICNCSWLYLKLKKWIFLRVKRFIFQPFSHSKMLSPVFMLSDYTLVSLFILQQNFQSFAALNSIREWQLLFFRFNCGVSSTIFCFRCLPQKLCRWKRVQTAWEHSARGSRNETRYRDRCSERATLPPREGPFSNEHISTTRVPRHTSPRFLFWREMWCAWGPLRDIC